MMKKLGWCCGLLVVLAWPVVHAEEERFVDKAGRTIKKGGEAIEKSAK